MTGAGAVRRNVETDLPRKPERINGVARYQLLVDAAERLMQASGVAGVTIQAVAKAARVPMASVYHFFPSPMAACLAVAEKHQARLAEIVAEPVAHSQAASFEDYLRDIGERTRAYYNDHPVAMRLILGSDCSWAIRETDLMHNRANANLLCQQLHERFGLPKDAAMERALQIVATTVDTIWGLSVMEHGHITEEYAREARCVAAAYLHATLAAKRA